MLLLFFELEEILISLKIEIKAGVFIMLSFILILILSDILILTLSFIFKNDFLELKIPFIL